MRISDWSSDVCSSDLHHRGRIDFAQEAHRARVILADDGVGVLRRMGVDVVNRLIHIVDDPDCEDRIQIFGIRSEEHTSELQSLMRISYAVFCLKKKNNLLFFLLSLSFSSFLLP